MPPLAHRLHLVRRLGWSAREAALSAAIDGASGDECGVLAAELIEASLVSSRDRALLLDVLAAWPRLGAETRSAAVSAAGDGLVSMIGELADSPRARRRAAAMEIIGDTVSRGTVAGSAAQRELIARLATATDDADDAVRSVTRDAVAAICSSRLEDDTRATATGPLEPELERALVKVLSRYDEHRHAETLRVAVDAAESASHDLRKWLMDDREPGHPALRSAARRLPLSKALARAVGWLAVPALSGAALEVLETVGEEAQTRILERAHLLRLRGRPRALKRLRSPERLVPGDSRLAEDPPPLRRAAIRLARLLAKPERRLLHISGFLADSDPLTRLHAVFALRLEPAGKLVDDTLADFALDPCETVSAAAACVLGNAQSTRRRSMLVPLFRTLLRSPHAATRLLSEQVLREFDPFPLLEGERAWENTVAARRMLESDRDGFMSLAKRLLDGESGRQRVVVLTAIGRLGLTREFFDELCRSTRDRDQRIVAKCVRLLGEIRSPDVQPVLREALLHPDQRVRADAVEALGRAGHDLPLDDLLVDESPRVRANATRAAMARRLSSGDRSLVRMLDDERPAHRVAGLWTAEYTGAVWLAARAVEMVNCDPDEAVRTRARRCAQRLLAASRLAWSEPPEGQTERRVGSTPEPGSPESGSPAPTQSESMAA